MRWLKRSLWKAGIALAGSLLLALGMWLMVIVVWPPVSAAGTYERASGIAGPGTVTLQTPSAADLTVTAVAQDKLKQDDEKARRDNSGIWPFLNALGGSIGTICLAIAAVIGTVFGFSQWRGNQNAERQKEIATQDKESKDRQEAQDKELRDRAEDRFKTAVTALGDEKEGAQVGGAILLRSFLNKVDEKTYARYYTQIFDLAVSYLRLPRTSNPPEDPNAPPLLTTLRQALIVVFKEAFPLARSQNKGGPQSLDATYIQLDNAYLAKADLEQAWMPQASLREVNLSWANLTKANLTKANLSGADLSATKIILADLNGADLSGAKITPADLSWADLRRADLSGAKIIGANLQGANLSGADLSGAKIDAYLSMVNFRGANLTKADLTKANLSGLDLTEAKLTAADLSGAKIIGANLQGANLSGANLSGADLSGAIIVRADLSGAIIVRADLSGADLSGADLSGARIIADLSGVRNLERIRSLKDAYLNRVEVGLTNEQLEACKAKGANILEVSSTNSFQSAFSPPAPSQCNNMQAQSALDMDGSSAPPSKPSPES